MNKYADCRQNYQDPSNSWAFTTNSSHCKSLPTSNSYIGDSTWGPRFHPTHRYVWHRVLVCQELRWEHAVFCIRDLVTTIMLLMFSYHRILLHWFCERLHQRHLSWLIIYDSFNSEIWSEPLISINVFFFLNASVDENPWLTHSLPFRPLTITQKLLFRVSP